MAQSTVRSPVNIYVKEGEVAVSYGLHGELDALADNVQVVQKSFSLPGPCYWMTKVSST